jgi:threonine dehydrogenase-like Zn-dependent dehydrogenase
LELGICGTDREILDSKRPHAPPGAEFLVLGHECLARVEQIGPMEGDAGVPLSERLRGGTTPLVEGDLVVPVVRRALPGYDRRVDMLAVGQFTERGIFDEHGFSIPYWLDEPRYLFRVPAELAAVAVLTEPLAVAAKGINEALILQQARMERNIWSDHPPRVLVTGMGPIAFAALQMSRARGWPTWMYGRDADDSPRVQVLRAWNGEYVRQAETALRCDSIEEEGFDLILECTGSDEVILEAAQALRSCGVMVWLGSQRDPRDKTQNLGRLVRDGLIRNNVFLGCVNAAPRDFAEALARLAQWNRECPQLLARIVTARVTQAEALAHLASRPPNSIKTVVVYS